MLVRFARARLFTDFFTDFEKKPTVLQSMCTYPMNADIICVVSTVCYKATTRNMSAFAGYVYSVTFIITNRLI